MKTKPKPPGKFQNGAPCKVLGGVHAGKSGIVTELHSSRTGHVTMTVLQPDGQQFKTLAKDVIVESVTS